MNTIPERAKNDRSEAPVLSRLARWRRDRKDEEYLPELPPIDGGEYLIDHLFDVGFGDAPIGSAELEAWSRMSGVPLNPWEARTIRRLSREYLHQAQLSEKLDCEAPWKPEHFAPEDLHATALSLKESLRSLATL